MGRQGVYSFKTDAVQADRLLEAFGVELAAGIDFRGHLAHFAEWYAASVVAHAYLAFPGYLDINPFAGAYVELVDGVVNHLLEQHIYAVLGVRAIA